MVIASKYSSRAASATWYTGLIIIIFIGLIIWAAAVLRIDTFSEALKGKSIISVLIVIDDGNKPLVSQILFIHPQTLNVALLAIPVETGTLLESVDRVDRLESLYNPGYIDEYQNKLGEMLAEEIDFVMRLHILDFERFVDYLGDIDVFIPNAIDEEINKVRYLFPSGVVSLDGAKARSFIEYKPPGELIFERSERERRVIQSFIRSIGESSEKILVENVMDNVDLLIAWQGDRASLASFIETVSGLESDGIVFLGILGKVRKLEGREILFPYYDSKLIKETVHRTRENLGKVRSLDNESLTVKVEILNGTNVNGLASRTSHLFRSYGFNVVSISNAENADYERTVILDRQGKPDAARQVAEVIGGDEVHTQYGERPDETVDVTVILGKDFDGRYVKK